MTMSNEFLGFGILRLLRRDKKNDRAADGGEALVRSAVGQILGTMAASDFAARKLVVTHCNDGSLLRLARSPLTLE